MCRCDTLSLSTRYLPDQKFRVSYMNLSHISFLHTSDSFNDEIYRLHLARAISRPCYLMASYVTITERKTEPALKLGGELTRGSPSLFSPEYIRNLSNSVASLVVDSHSQADPLEKNFQAVPDCRNHAECNDPMFRSLALCRTVKDLSSHSPEYKQEYRKLAAETQQFAINLMAMCKDTAEVDLLLSESAGTSHLLRNSASMKYPRLRLAIELNEKEFVGHMYCQQILTQQWSGNICWYRRHPLLKVVCILLQIIFTPIFACCFIFKTLLEDLTEGCGGRNDFLNNLSHRVSQCWVFTSLNIPINRCISYFSSLILIMMLLIEAVLSPISDTKADCNHIVRLHQYHYALTFMMVAIVIRELEDLVAVRSVRIYMNFDFWRIYRIINQLLIIIALACQFHLHFKIDNNVEPKSGNTSQPLQNNCSSFEEIETEVRVTYAFYSVAATVSVIHLFYWLQLNDKLGPVVISASQVIMDVFTISSMYVIFLIGFSGGIIFILHTERVTQSFDKVRRPLHSTSTSEDFGFGSTMEFLFWQSIMPEYPQQEIKLTLSPFSEAFSKVLFASFQTIIIIVFLNLLIAVMNATVQKIQDKKELYWKFARSSIWIRFFDDNKALPPPFNLVSVLRLLVKFIINNLTSRKRKLSGSLPVVNTRKYERQLKYKALMLSLIERYQENQMRLEDERISCHCQFEK